MSLMTTREAELAAENRHLRRSVASREGWKTRRQRQAEPAKPVECQTDNLLAFLAARRPDDYERVVRKLGRIA